jgi:hypothetical protein
LAADTVLFPASDGNRQSLWPAKLAAFTWLIQSHTVVGTPIASRSTLHVPLTHVLHPCAPPSEFAAHVAAAAAFGWQKFAMVLQSPSQHPAHE